MAHHSACAILSATNSLHFGIPLTRSHVTRMERRSFLGCRIVAVKAETVTAKTPITFHIGETSLTVPFSIDTAKGLSSAITGLLTTFKEKEKAARPQRWSNMEYRQTEDGVFLEVFCNPNAHATAFQAKYLITINDEKMRIASEGQLSALKSDVDQYIDSQS